MSEAWNGVVVAGEAPRGSTPRICGVMPAVGSRTEASSGAKGCQSGHSLLERTLQACRGAARQAPSWAMDPELLDALRRNSGLRLDGDGQFFFHERPVENDRVQRLFHRHLAVRADGGVTLTVGSQWAYVACETVARFVERFTLDDGSLSLRFRDGEEVIAKAPQLGFAPDGRCYVWATESASPAVLLRSAHQALASLLEEKEGGLVLPLRSGDISVATLEHPPTPDAHWPGGAGA